MTETTTYRSHVLPSPLCPVCNHARDGLHCGMCGHVEEANPVPEARPVPAPPPAAKSTYHSCVIESPVCKNCSAALILVEGHRQCSVCGEEAPAPKPSIVVRQPEPVTPITADFLLCTHPTLKREPDDGIEPCNRDLVTTMRNDDIPKFICSICGDSKPYPGLQSPIAAAVASVPVVGPAVVQAAEAVATALRPQKRRR